MEGPAIDNPHLVDFNTGILPNDFHRIFFEFVMMTDGYYYNNHLARNGDTKTARRWLRGDRGNQKNHIKVTSDFDKSKPAVVEEVEDDEDTMKYFAKLAS